MKVLAVVLTSSHTCYALRAYNSIKNQLPVKFTYDIIINVNSTNKNYFKQVQETFKDIDVEIVETESNGRPGMGHNSVLKLFRERAEYDYLIMLDGDDMFYPCAFKQFEQLLHKKPDTDVAHLMINDNISTNDQDKKRVQLNGNYFLYTSADLQENWWEKLQLKDPFNDPLYMCRTPSRLLLASRRIFESRIPIEYSEKCHLYDDFKAFLSWCEASYEGCLNVYSLSDPLIYCYNGQNDDSVTYKFTKSQHDEEQLAFNEETKQYTALRYDWYKKLGSLPWVHLDAPDNFGLKERIDFANKEFVDFEINDAVKHAKEYQLAEDYMRAKRQYQNAERGGVHNLQLKINLAVCYHKLNLLEKAVNTYQESLQIEHTFIAHRNLMMIYAQLNKPQLAFKHLVRAEKFPEASRPEFSTQLQTYKHQFQKLNLLKSQPIQKKIGTKPILCIYTGYSPAYNGKNYQDRNVWGSEIAAVHMAELLSEHYQVFVFCPCDEELEHNGVNYYHFNKFEPFQQQIHINVMIVSRFVHFFMAFRVKADKLFYWAHDARIHDAFQGQFLENQGTYLFHNMLDKIDGIICVSSWHKNYFMNWAKIPDGDRYKVHIIRNGLDLSYFDDNLPKTENRMIWASNPDRGLDILLKCYPRIQKEIPDLTLDIYYSDLHGEKMPKERYEFILHQVKTLPGVKFHGKISEKQLCLEYCKADIMPYFNRSHETYCISALQACAGGCAVVCRNYTGLKDSVGPAGFLLNGDVDDEEWQNKATQLIIKLLKDKDHKVKVQDMARKWGKQNQWISRIDKWLSILDLKKTHSNSNDESIGTLGEGLPSDIA